LTDQEEENLEAMDKLFAEKESMDKQDQKRYRYYGDLYGNEYRWTTHKQDDGKFKATILKVSTSGGWIRHTKTKERSFVKRRTAKSWCLKHCQKANQHQRVVLNARAERKQQRLDAKPKLTPAQISFKHAESKLQHFEKLKVKGNKKIKSLQTRNKNYQKRMGYYQKRMEKLSNHRIASFI